MSILYEKVVCDRVRTATVVCRISNFTLLTYIAGSHAGIKCLCLRVAREVLAWSSLTKITDKSWLSYLDLIRNCSALEAHVRIADEGLLVCAGSGNLSRLYTLSIALVATLVDGHVIEASRGRCVILVTTYIVYEHVLALSWCTASPFFIS